MQWYGNRDRQEATNYRPISLTSCVARVLEKLINVHLLKFLQENSLLCHQQAGFLPSQPTITQFCFLKHKMADSIGQRRQCRGGLDRVSVPGLIYKLSQTGFSQAALQWFSSFLSGRRQCVQVNGSCSSWQTVISGIPQGTVLGPTLFLLFIDLPECLVNECALFADDTSAYGVGKDSSQLC